MPIFFNVDYRMVGVLARQNGVAKRVRDEAIRFGMFQVARFWARHYLPEHFNSRNRQKYRHKRRKPAYRRIKRLMYDGKTFIDPLTGQPDSRDVIKKGSVDIVFTGKSEHKAEGNQGIRATTKGFVIKMRVPRYLVQRRRGSYPDMKKEIASSTTAEANILRKVFWANYRRFIRNHRNNTKVKV